jgi:hypothetical protein
MQHGAARKIPMPPKGPRGRSVRWGPDVGLTPRQRALIEQGRAIAAAPAAAAAPRRGAAAAVAPLRLLRPDAHVDAYHLTRHERIMLGGRALRCPQVLL